MQMLNYSRIATQQRWKDLRAFFVEHPDKVSRATYVAGLRAQMDREREEYNILALRQRDNSDLEQVLDNYGHGLIALREVDGVEAY